MDTLWDAQTAEKQLVEAVVQDEFVNGIRIDAFLAQAFPDNSRVFFQNCIQEHRVFLNGRPCKKADKAFPGNVIEIDWPQDENAPIQAENIPLDILHEDDDIIVINKPAGLVVHPAHGNRTGTLVQGLLFHDEASFEDMLVDSERPGIVHRLDKDTSGVLIVAKNPTALATLKTTFQKHDLDKIYLAIAIGNFTDKYGTVNAPIGRHPTNRLRMAIDTQFGKEAISQYKVVAEIPGFSLVKVRILTGRTHQIRVHLSHIGHPILGDPFYGGRPKNLENLPERQMLHAWKLNIPHPTTGEKCLFCAQPPEDFSSQVQKLFNLSISELS